MTTRKRNGTDGGDTVTIRLRPGQQVVIDAPTNGHHRLVGAAEIAAMLGVSRQHVHQLTRRPGFPPPLAELAMGTVWDGEVITAWNATRTRRRT